MRLRATIGDAIFVLGHVPAWPEAMGLLLVMTGLIMAVTTAAASTAKA